jgi:hypothetical protein
VSPPGSTLLQCGDVARDSRARPISRFDFVRDPFTHFSWLAVSMQNRKAFTNQDVRGPGGEAGDLAFAIGDGGKPHRLYEPDYFHVSWLHYFILFLLGFFDSNSAMPGSLEPQGDGRRVVEFEAFASTPQLGCFPMVGYAAFARRRGAGGGSRRRRRGVRVWRYLIGPQRRGNAAVAKMDGYLVGQVQDGAALITGRPIGVEFHEHRRSSSQIGRARADISYFLIGSFSHSIQ